MGAEDVDLAVFLAYFFHGDHQEDEVVGAGNLGAFPLLHYFRNCDIKNTCLVPFFLVLTGRACWSATFRYVGAT